MGERSSKKQRELLNWVDGFIKEHGYGPSYREVMNGLGYRSVSTVAIHIDGLISKGYLRKRDNSARSLEVVSTEYKAGENTVHAPNAAGGSAGASREKWLVKAIEDRFALYSAKADSQTMDELYVLIGALKVLGFDAAYEAMRSKLARIMQR